MNGDLISRDAALEAVKATGVVSAQEKLRIMVAVRAVPAVEAEPVVHARWIPRHRRGNNWCECSNCNTVGSPFWKRCPLCEAKMDETTEIRTCYCPLCDKHFKVRSNDSSGDCPDCGHHVVLREVEVSDGT